MKYTPPDYDPIHKRIRYHRGSAYQYKCIDCEAIAHEWSYIHETDPYDIDNYEPRCKSCHCIYDGVTVNYEPKGEKHGKAKLKERDVIEIRYLYSTGDFSYSELSQLYKISSVHVSDIIKRKYWNHI